MKGLPELPPPDPKAASAAQGEPVEREFLEKVLSYLDPDVPEPEWRTVLVGIHATPGLDYAERLEIANNWSVGDYDREKRFEKSVEPEKYQGSDKVEDKFACIKTKPPGEGIGFGTLVRMAQDAGMGCGPKPDDARPAAETFAHLNGKAGEGKEELHPWIGGADVFDSPRQKALDDDNIFPAGPSRVLRTAKEKAGKTTAAVGELIRLAVKKNLRVGYAALEAFDEVAAVLMPAYFRELDVPIEDWSKYFMLTPVFPKLYDPKNRPAVVKFIKDTKPFRFDILALDPRSKVAGAVNNDEHDKCADEFTDGIADGLSTCLLEIAHEGTDETKGVIGQKNSQRSGATILRFRKGAGTRRILIIESRRSTAGGPSKIVFDAKRVPVCDRDGRPTGATTLINYRTDETAPPDRSLSPAEQKVAKADWNFSVAARVAIDAAGAHSSGMSISSERLDTLLADADCVNYQEANGESPDREFKTRARRSWQRKRRAATGTAAARRDYVLTAALYDDEDGTGKNLRWYI